MEFPIYVFDKQNECDRPKLKLCPFCGGKAEIKFVRAGTIEAFKVKCTMCRAESDLYRIQPEYCSSKMFNEPIKKCADAWNARAK